MAQKYVKIASFGKFKYDDSVTPNAIDTDGDVEQADSPRCSVYMSANQQLTTVDTFYTVEFDSEHFDIEGNFNTSTYTFTAPSTGHYLLSYIIIWNSSGLSGLDRLRMRIMKNGNSFHINTTRVPSSVAKEGVSGSLLLSLNDSDTINIEAKNRDTAGTFLDGSSNSTALSIVKI